MRHPAPRFAARLLAAALLAFPGCGSGAGPTASRPDGGVHVLFVGNSLTYTNALPRTLADLAATTGDTIRAASVAYPDFALVDHLANGAAARAIAAGGWRYVVLQQGPSSVQANRDSLVDMTRRFDAAIRAAGARTALLSVWPQTVNLSTFDRAIESYRLAAAAVDGLYLPVGLAWQLALARAPAPPLYAPDGLHPSPLGTYLAALVIYERFTGKDARLLPPRAVVDGRDVGAAEAVVRALQQAAHDANAAS